MHFPRQPHVYMYTQIFREAASQSLLCFFRFSGEETWTPNSLLCVVIFGWSIFFTLEVCVLPRENTSDLDFISRTVFLILFCSRTALSLKVLWTFVRSSLLCLLFPFSEESTLKITIMKAALGSFFACSFYGLTFNPVQAFCAQKCFL